MANIFVRTAGGDTTIILLIDGLPHLHSRCGGGCGDNGDIGFDLDVIGDCERSEGDELDGRRVTEVGDVPSNGKEEDVRKIAGEVVMVGVKESVVLAEGLLSLGLLASFTIVDNIFWLVDAARKMVTR